MCLDFTKMLQAASFADEQLQEAQGLLELANDERESLQKRKLSQNSKIS